MKSIPELYVIGKRITRKKIIIMLMMCIALGVVITLIMHSIILGSICVVLATIISIYITRNIYWIVSNNGIYTPMNFGLFKYFIVMSKYLFVGDEKSKIIFIDYRKIKYLQLISEKIDYEIKNIIIKNDFICIKIDKKYFNQDLIDSILYIKRKGVNINNIELLEKINIRSTGDVNITNKNIF